MRKFLLPLALLSASAAAIAQTPPGHPVVDAADMAKHGAATAAVDLPNMGEVQEVLQTDAYTYLNVKDTNGTRWIAVSHIKVGNGAMVRYSKGSEMTDFKSKALDRTFPEILFAGAIEIVGNEHPSIEETADILNIADASDLPNKGTVKSSLQSGAYTYIEADKGDKTEWLAVPRTDVQNGARISYADGAVMKNFYSKKLGREFAEVIFLKSIKVVGQ